MTEENTTGAAAATEEAATPGQQFALQRVYLKDMSFEAPMGVKAFMQEWKPQVDQELNTKANKVDDTSFEVTLTLTVTVKLGEETAFLVEVQQGGLFHISGLPEQALPQVLNTACPQILFPYAREAIDNVVVKGSFPALMLPPVNFDALFAHAVQQAKAQQEAQGAAEPATEQ
ncbi:protein-export chaperone SecB [Simiduia aestuariiviva]|uniref:Protein-export protein SecB n=1 Tax=Simiduia aestuariiviva TaxID=1510459 RepID=A0A839UGY9_9GAMM|nr:protein-export chaperone SecB [Simiduia aestuariiviva]MBB3167142.1 preprotein translocase subunit SecB [Simiduia aestuariiviva]